MIQEFEYMGHGHKYWLELERRAKELSAVQLIEEIAELRGKVAFYESRIKEMAMVMNREESK